MLRARATAELGDALDADLDRRGASELLRDVELPLVSVLAAMEQAGIAADTDHLAAMSASLGGEVKAAEQAAFAAVGHEFNLGSPKQLQEVLFTELALPKTKRIKTGYTTDSEALTSLLAQTEHPVLAHLLRYRDVAKLKSIVDSLVPMAGEDGRIHTTYNQMIAATGRLSSTDPNLQNIPIRTEEGRRIRQGFVVGPGYETLLTADYSQIELRIMADLSGDTALEEAFSSGRDFHAETASRVFGVPADEVTPEMRSKIKAMNYGLAYGLSAYGLSQQLRIAAEEAARPDGRVLPAVRRHPGLPARRWWTRRARTVTPRPSWAAAATCPISPRTTGSAARWRSGWRSTRRSRARRRTSSRWPCSGSTRPSATRGCAPGCCSRSTMSWSSRSPRASWTPCAPWSRRPCAPPSTCACRCGCRLGTGRSWAEAGH